MFRERSASCDRNIENSSHTNTDTNLPRRNSAEPPNGAYGWVCVACCFWINAHSRLPCLDNISEICLSQDDLLILNFTIAWGVHYMLCLSPSHRAVTDLALDLGKLLIRSISRLLSQQQLLPRSNGFALCLCRWPVHFSSSPRLTLGNHHDSIIRY